MLYSLGSCGVERHHPSQQSLTDAIRVLRWQLETQPRAFIIEAQNGKNKVLASFRASTIGAIAQELINRGFTDAV